ncbi:MAG: nuclear transport factor 2 family protein, partial [Candidatus Acidiferrales bacterium]
MSGNKDVIGAYFASTGTEYSRLLADDIELVEWAEGVPPSGVRTRGKAAFVENRGNREFQTQLTRITEENNVVVVEGMARGAKKEGGFWMVQFCDVFELEDGKVKKLTSLGVGVKESG